ncbi:MAG: TonB family protein [Paludibacteraceae bacterium]|nr:TonB family protein [Paludibacteraceae bacterium]
MTFRLSTLLLFAGLCTQSVQAYQFGEIMAKMNVVHLTPDIYPSFKGGDQALLKYIGKNNQAPISADGKKIKGKVAVKFVIEEDGTTGEIEIYRSSQKAEVDSAGIAFVKNMPRWIPGIEDGRPVRCLYILPLHLK